jgi:hypothetical protein
MCRRGSQGLWSLVGLSTLLLSVHLPVMAQVSQAEVGQCILVGRISGFGRWAPRQPQFELLDDKGQQVIDESAESLASVKQVRVNAPALLVKCHRVQGGPKSDVGNMLPAIAPGSEPLAVKALSMVPVGIGGHWVELEVALVQERVTRIPAQTN